jgi:hypothetical protein
MKCLDLEWSRWDSMQEQKRERERERELGAVCSSGEKEGDRQVTGENKYSSDLSCNCYI